MMLPIARNPMKKEAVVALDVVIILENDIRRVEKYWMTYTNDVDADDVENEWMEDDCLVVVNVSFLLL